MKKIDDRLFEFNLLNQDLLNELWADHVASGEWGSGADRIAITDDMYWEFVDELMFDVERLKNPHGLKPLLRLVC